jgi:hypothetical protein
MIRHILPLLIFIFIIGNSLAQNIIPNGSFEEYTKLPDNRFEFENLNNWMSPNHGPKEFPNGSPDFYHLKASGSAKIPNDEDNLTPHSGKGISGMTCYSSMDEYREYMMVKFIQPMVKGQTYHVEFYVSRGEANTSPWCVNNFGMHFTNTEAEQPAGDPLNLEPQVEYKNIVSSNDWQRIEFEYTADDNYTLMIFGNFRKDAQCSTKKVASESGNIGYYYFDDFSIVPATATSDNSSQPPVVNKAPDVFEGRNVTTQHIEYISADSLTLLIFDSQKIDGDIISLHYNGEWILQNYELKKVPLSITVPIKHEGENYLLLYAHNLGTLPPNTATVRFMVNGQAKQIDLESKLNECGTIEFIYK